MEECYVSELVKQGKGRQKLKYFASGTASLPRGAPRASKKHPGLFCVDQVGVNMSLAPPAMHLAKLLPVKELYNGMTNVSKVIHHLQGTII